MLISEGDYVEAIFVFGTLILIMFIIAIVYNDYTVNKIKEDIRDQITDLANNTIEVTPAEFFEMRNKSFGGRALYSNNYNFAGVYILYNESKDLY